MIHEIDLLWYIKILLHENHEDHEYFNKEKKLLVHLEKAAALILEEQISGSGLFTSMQNSKCTNLINST